MRRHDLQAAFAATVIAGALLANACATTREKEERRERVAGKEAWRDTRPVAAAPAPVSFPNYQRIDLKNGLPVVLVEEHGLPAVYVTVAVRAGSAMDGREPGLANLTWDLLDEGMGDLPAAGVANAFGDIGTVVDVGASRDWGSASIQVQRGDLERGLELLSQMVRSPSFNAADVERLKKLHLASLQGKQGDPDTLAWQLLAAEVYGADHAYGHPGDGTPASVEKLKQSAVKRFWTEHAGPKNAALVIIGDVTPDDARTLAEKHFGKWKGGPAKAPKPPAAPKPRKGTRIVVVDFPGAPQTMIRIGRSFMSATDAELPQAIVMNQVLGGMFTSRLNLKLREEKGWTYGAFSSVDARYGPGPFLISTDVQTDKTGEALVEVFVQLDTLKTGGVTEEELALGRANFVRSLPGLFAVAPLQSAQAVETFALGLPADHHQKLAAAVEAVTADQAKAAAARAIDIDDLVVVLVGDRAAIAAGLEGKGLGEVVFMNRDGTPAK
jgi:zinc protease